MGLLSFLKRIFKGDGKLYPESLTQVGFDSERIWVKHPDQDEESILWEELIGVAVSGQRWSDKKFFRFFILVWILLLFIQTIGIVIGKSHPPFVNS